jgi:YHS domain-containing protein
MKKPILFNGSVAGLAAGSAFLLAVLTGGCGTPGQTDLQGSAEVGTAKPYPLKTCLVSGEELGTMGKAPVLVYQGQEIKFCCKDCIKDFKADPEKYIAKLKEEAGAATKP